MGDTWETDASPLGRNTQGRMGKEDTWKTHATPPGGHARGKGAKKAHVSHLVGRMSKRKVME